MSDDAHYTVTLRTIGIESMDEAKALANLLNDAFCAMPCAQHLGCSVSWGGDAADGTRATPPDRWQPIETAPPEDHETFLVFDGIGVWKAWRLNGEIAGYEVDGAELPSDDYPPTHWMLQPAPPQEADT